LVILNPTWLPLKDLFCNKEIEINIDLGQVKNVFETLKMSQINPAIIKQ